MKTAIGSRNDSGAVTWIWLAVLVLVIVAAAIAVPFLPRSEAPEKPPAAVRAKIPQTPKPEAQPKPQTAQVKIPPPPAAPAGDVQSQTAPEAVAEKAEVMPPTTSSEGADDAGKIPLPPKEPAANAQTDQSLAVNEVAREDASTASPTQATQDSAQEQKPVKALAAVTPPAASEPAEKQPLPAKAAEPPAPSKAVSKEKAPAASSVPAPGSVEDKDVMIEESLKPFTIQVGAFRTKSNAENLAIKLKRRGYDVYIFEYLDDNAQSLYLVRLGHFDTRQDADAELEAFKLKEKMTAVVARSQQL